MDYIVRLTSRSHQSHPGNGGYWVTGSRARYTLLLLIIITIRCRSRGRPRGELNEPEISEVKHYRFRAFSSVRRNMTYTYILYMYIYNNIKFNIIM